MNTAVTGALCFKYTEDGACCKEIKDTITLDCYFLVWFTWKVLGHCTEC